MAGLAGGCGEVPFRARAARGTRLEGLREVVSFGEQLRGIAEVAGSRVAPAQVAIVHDWHSRWAAELDSHPSVDAVPFPEARRWHSLLWQRNVGVDFVHPLGDVSSYRVVVLPVSYLLVDAAIDGFADFVRAGGTLIVTYFSGIVDDHDHIRLGGYPGAVLGEVLGVRIEEFYPLLAGERVQLSAHGPGSIWSELGRSTGADVLAEYASGPCAGSPAVTRNRFGTGTAYYLGTSLDAEGAGCLLDAALRDAGVEAVLSGLLPRVEVQRRLGETGSYLFVINHGDVDVTMPSRSIDLLTGEPMDVVPTGGAAVFRESRCIRSNPLDEAPQYVRSIGAAGST